MTVTELAKLVADMRQAQKRYFRTRYPADLNESIRLEVLVDKAVKDALAQPMFSWRDEP